MKRVCLLLFVVFAVCALAPRGARAADELLPPGVLPLEEGTDAWLHDRCSYRGIELYTPELLTRPGTITELASVTYGLFDRITTRRVKLFRCDEKPSFWSAAFVAAPAASVRCEEESPQPKLCVPPIRKRPVAATKPQASTPTSAIVAVAEIAPSPPKTAPVDAATSPSPSVRARSTAPPPKKDRRTDKTRTPRGGAPRGGSAGEASSKGAPR